MAKIKKKHFSGYASPNPASRTCENVNAYYASIQVIESSFATVFRMDVMSFVIEELLQFK